MKKKFSLLMSVLSLTGCGGIYTIKNEMPELIRAGSQKVPPGKCLELSDSSFGGFFGDFPLAITKEDGSALSDNVDKNKTYEAGHYVVTAEGEVNLSDKACQDMILSQETVKDSRRSEGVVSEEDLTPIETTAKDTPNATQQPEKTLKTVKTPPPVTTVVEEPPKQNQQPEQQSEGTTEENSFSWSWLWDWIPGL